jgi:Xaa-Pro aminopeptidase
MVQLAQMAGIAETRPVASLASDLQGAGDDRRTIHILPPYRAAHEQGLGQMLGLTPQQIRQRISADLIKAVVTQRSIKDKQEIEQIESALEVTRKMHLEAMQKTRPGIWEYEVVGAMLCAAYANNGYTPAYPPIFSVRGEVLHNPHHGNRMQSGQLAINDTGAQSPMHYAGDITRTLPVSGSFTQQQADIYSLVLTAQTQAIGALKPGVRFVDIHLATARCLARGLADLGLMRGDPDEIVAQGAHALFFPHGLGHMLGLDVHDMENLGEDAVGYDETVRRSPTFGLSSLRLARDMQPGFVVTVEPGLYFIPGLIDLWRSENRHGSFIHYSRLEAYRNFGGVRIEDNVLITGDGCRVLGPAIAKTIKELSRS